MISEPAPVTLLIDDDEDDVFFMTRAMKEAGIESTLQVARDGLTAMDYLRRSGEFTDRRKSPTPGLIFLDLKLPKVPGLDVLRWVREQPEFAKIIIIVLTSSVAPFDLNRALQLGANSVLEKPPTATKILELARAFRLWGHLGKLAQ
jgi:CheY-like chemotaxis protein